MARSITARRLIASLALRVAKSLQWDTSMTFNELALFSGAGGGILGGHLLGWRTVCAVEWEPYPASVLCARQNDGILPPFPIWDDVQTFDGRPWRGRVDVVSGGFPCQDISAIKQNAKGIDGPDSSMWCHMARVIGEVRPRFVFVENSPRLIQRGLARVVSDLASLGYDCRWDVIGADDAGFAHHRKRLWLVGYAHEPRLEGHAGHEQGSRGGAKASRSATEAGLCSAGWKRVVYSADCNEDGECPLCGVDYGNCRCPGPTMDECQYIEHDGELWGRAKAKWIEPGMGRMAGRSADYVDRTKAYGNTQVPAVAALAWEILTADFMN